MPERYRFGDYVLLPDCKRGFFVRYRSTGSCDVIVFHDGATQADGRDTLTYSCLPMSVLGLSAQEPSEFEQVAWAKWSLLRAITK